MRFSPKGSPTRKSPFDVDMRYRKTEWEQKEPYLYMYNRISNSKSPSRPIPAPRAKSKVGQRNGPRVFKVKRCKETSKIKLPDEQFCAFCDDYVHPDCYNDAVSPQRGQCKLFF